MTDDDERERWLKTVTDVDAIVDLGNGHWWLRTKSEWLLGAADLRWIADELDRRNGEGT